MTSFLLLSQFYTIQNIIEKSKRPENITLIAVPRMCINPLEVGLYPANQFVIPYQGKTAWPENYRG